MTGRDVQVVKSELGMAAQAYRSASRAVDGAVDTLPAAPPYMGAASAAYGEVLAEFYNSCANLNEVARKVADDLEACQRTYGENENQTADLFKNVRR